MDKKELERRLTNVSCPSIYYPTVLDNDKYSVSFKTNIKSRVFPTLKEKIENGISVFYISINTNEDIALYKGFGYLYTYCVANELSKKKIPLFLTREDLQNALKENDPDNYKNSDSILFIGDVTRDSGFYSKEELRVFSNFIYDRSINNRVTVLGCSSLMLSSTQEFLTPFMYSYISNMGFTIPMIEK